MSLTARMERVSQDDWSCAAVSNVFPLHFYQQIVSGLPELKWAEAAKDFYRQREVNLADNAHFRALFNVQVRGQIVHAIGSFFGVTLGANFDIAAHKMITGDYIGVHTDANQFGETHRMTITLNDGWTVEEGGVLLALNGGGLNSLRDAWLPTANNGFLFAISQNSYHAVTPIVGMRPRYSLILTFKRVNHETKKGPTWTPFVLQSDLQSATVTAGYMGISVSTFDKPYKYVEFDSVDGLRDFVKNQLDNAPSHWTYQQGSSINVDQFGNQPKGTDADRVAVVSQLRRIPPLLLVRRKSGQYCLVDGSHRLSHATDRRMGIGIAIFDE